MLLSFNISTSLLETRNEINLFTIVKNILTRMRRSISTMKSMYSRALLPHKIELKLMSTILFEITMISEYSNQNFFYRRLIIKISLVQYLWSFILKFHQKELSHDVIMIFFWFHFFLSFHSNIHVFSMIRRVSVIVRTRFYHRFIASQIYSNKLIHLRYVRILIFEIDYLQSK